MKIELVINFLVLIVLAFVAKGILIIHNIDPQVLQSYKCVQSLEAYLYITGIMAIAIGISFNVGVVMEKGDQID
jgi:hypothetical protein